MEFVIVSVKCSGIGMGIGVEMRSRTGMLRWVLMLNGLFILKVMLTEVCMIMLMFGWML